MRVVGDIPNPHCKISIFSWNNKYLVKLEQGALEQTYKINELDIIDEGDISKLVDNEFIKKALSLFDEMGKLLNDALQKV